MDRIKDVIIRGGENIYAAEIEAVLYEHPDVQEAAIVGIPDEKYGEIVGAFIRLHDGATVNEDGIRDWVRGRLAAFKVPAVVDLRDRRATPQRDGQSPQARTPRDLQGVAPGSVPRRVRQIVGTDWGGGGPT